jgi:hypothetical protein
MNTYFLRLLSKDKKRKKNKANIVYVDQEWKTNQVMPGLEIGDMVITSTWKYILSNEGWVCNLVPSSLEVTDQRFNPTYWGDDISFFFSDSIITRLIDTFQKGKNRMRIGKKKYNFILNDISITRILDYRNHVIFKVCETYHETYILVGIMLCDMEDVD